MARMELNVADVRRLPLTYGTTIPEDYLDSMGHMNVMWYTHLFSGGTGGLFELVGLTLEHLQASQAGTFALESHVRYLSEVRVGQSVDIYTRVLARSHKRYHAMHFMINREKEDMAATSEVVGAYIDMRTRRMAALPEQVSRRFDALISEHSAIGWEAPACGAMGP